MRQGKLWRTFAALSAAALLATACGGGDGETEGEADPGTTDETTEATTEDATGEETGEAAAGGSFSTYICEPEALVPTNDYESCGFEVLNTVFDHLVSYTEELDTVWGDDEGAERAMAASIESEDSQTWTITLKEGWTFHDGTPVTAQSYVDSWNFAAYGPNAQQLNFFFANIEGYDAMNPQPPEGETEAPEPETDELSGLEVIDEQTFEVTLTEPFSQFPVTLGFNAFTAMPEVAFEDIEAFNEQPIGSGPYMLDGAWQHDQAINVTKYADYGGGIEANADNVEFRIYSDINTAYTDLQAGNLDIMDSIPPEQLGTAQDEFGDRYIEGPSSSYTYIGMPVGGEFENDEMAQALSMAIDRQAIIDAVFDGNLTPAGSLVSPAVPGHRDDACGEGCTFDPEAAAELFEQAGGLDALPETVNIYFNSGAGHEEWISAVTAQWREHLGIENVEFVTLQFADYLAQLNAGDVDGPFRLGWLADYPSMENYLTPMHGCDVSSSYGYCNEEADEIITEANQAPSLEEAIVGYQEAEDIILADWHHIPMWYGLVNAAHSERVSNVKIDALENQNIPEIEVVQ